MLLFDKSKSESSEQNCNDMTDYCTVQYYALLRSNTGTGTGIQLRPRGECQVSGLRAAFLSVVTFLSVAMKSQIHREDCYALLFNSLIIHALHLPILPSTHPYTPIYPHTHTILFIHTVCL
jgi:hypothetical protein